MIRGHAIGTYVIVGRGVLPAVAMLAVDQHEAFNRRMMIAAGTRQPEAAGKEVLALTFGRGVDFAFPAWIDVLMEDLAQSYAGPHQTAVRGLCAAIALGEPYGGPEPGSRPDGGVRDRIPRPRGPKSPGPVIVRSEVVSQARGG